MQKHNSPPYDLSNSKGFIKKILRTRIVGTLLICNHEYTFNAHSNLSNTTNLLIKDEGPLCSQ